MTSDFDALCSLYAKALNRDATEPRTIKYKAGEGIEDPLLDPVYVPFPPKRTLTAETITPAVSDDKYPLGALRLINGRFYEKTGVGTWVPTDWFP